jgi:dihydrodipicolinate synthase/N-acetylneuraminate lyase
VYSLDLGHGYLPTADEQRTYLRTVLDHAPGDLVLSTHQSVGYHYEPSLVASLLDEHPRIVGVNVTHRDLVYVAEVVDAIDGRVDVHVGGPMHALGATALGGIVGAKAALRVLGAPGGWPRPPRLPVAPERAQALVDVLVRLGVAADEGLRR